MWRRLLLRVREAANFVPDEGVNSSDDEGVNEGVKSLLDVIRSNPGKRANELATLIGKSVQTVERYVRTLKDGGRVEFRGAPKNGGYYIAGEKQKSPLLASSLTT